MWVVFAFIVLASEAAYGQQHCIPIAFVACDKILSREDINRARDVTLTPTEEELKETCPSLQRIEDCLVEQLDKCGEAETTASQEGFIQFTRGSKAVLDELCDESSSLHANYVSNADCYRSLLSTVEACENHAGSIFQTYKQYQQSNSQEMEEMKNGRYRYCFVQAYKVACLSVRINLQCGEQARSTFLDIVRRSNYLKQYCSQTIKEDLQTKFLDFTGLEGEERDLMADAFNFRRK